jgi:TonB family protein
MFGKRLSEEASEPLAGKISSSFRLSLQDVFESGYDSSTKNRTCTANLVITPPESVRAVAAGWLQRDPEIRTALLRAQIVNEIQEAVAKGEVPDTQEEIDKQVRFAAEQSNMKAGMNLLAGNLFGLFDDMSDSKKLKKQLDDIERLGFLTKLQKRQYEILVMADTSLPNRINRKVGERFDAAKETRTDKLFTFQLPADGVFTFRVNYFIRLNSEGNSIVSTFLPPSLSEPTALATVSADLAAYRDAIQKLNQPAPAPRAEPAEAALSAPKVENRTATEEPPPNTTVPAPLVPDTQNMNVGAKAEQAASARALGLADYAAKIRNKIKGNIILPASITGNPEAVFEVAQSPTGEIIDVRLIQSSGNEALDDAVHRAIKKSDPLPLPNQPDFFTRDLELRYKPFDGEAGMAPHSIDAIPQPATTGTQNTVSTEFVVVAPEESRLFLTEMLQHATKAFKVSEIKGKIEVLPKPAKGDRKAARKLNEQGLAALKSNDFAQAIAIFKSGAATDPSDAEVLNNYLYALIKVNRLQDAEIEAGRLLSFTPGRSSAWANLAEIYALEDKKEEAVAALILAFQFSSNKDRTIAFLNDHAAKPDSPLQAASRKAIEAIQDM